MNNFKARINNSYESDLTSSDGSLVSENCDASQSMEENFMTNVLKFQNGRLNSDNNNVMHYTDIQGKEDHLESKVSFEKDINMSNQPNVYKDDSTVQKKLNYNPNGKINPQEGTENELQITSTEIIKNNSLKGDENHSGNSESDSFKRREKILGSEKELLKRIRKSLSGVHPPPSVTMVEIDLFQAITEKKGCILDLRNAFKEKPLTDDSDNKGNDKEKMIFKPLNTFEEVKSMSWPNTLNAKCLGLSYNLSNLSEKIELLSLSVLERYVKFETMTSFELDPSSPKKRNLRSRMIARSPGSRLSHLAKRRAVFSSANLQSNLQNLANGKINNRQILLETKKSNNRRKLKGLTPKRIIPVKSENGKKTPSSSAQKRLTFEQIKERPGPSRETSKRALFQSPPKPLEHIQNRQQSTGNRPQINPEIATRVAKSKRALFSPYSNSNTSSQIVVNPNCNSEEFGLKRKRNSEVDENIHEKSKRSKLSTEDSFLNNENLTPRSFKIKSQSFSVEAGTRSTNININEGKSLIRASSDTKVIPIQLTENHKKKLLWAVSQALQSKQINITHPNFKQYASVLARVVKRLFLEMGTKSSSTSDTMLRFAKKHVFWVIQGKTVDEIYLEEKKANAQKKLQKPAGYIAPNSYNESKIFGNLSKKSSEISLFSESSVDSSYFSQVTSSPKSAITFYNNNETTTMNKSQNAIQIQKENYLKDLHSPQRNTSLSSVIIDDKNVCNRSSQKLQMQNNENCKMQQNSTSKNNLFGIVLRENVDNELRKSTQKQNSVGKDQMNMSPYIEQQRHHQQHQKLSSSKKFQFLSNGNNNGLMNSNGSIKAKRQISFE